MSKFCRKRKVLLEKESKTFTCPMAAIFKNRKADACKLLVPNDTDEQVDSEVLTGSSVE